VSAAVAVPGDIGVKASVEVIMTDEKPIFQECVSLAGRVARTRGYPALGIRYLQVEGCAGPTRETERLGRMQGPACMRHIVSRFA